jgi:exodeoxyribonuclease V gamma subunit
MEVVALNDEAAWEHFRDKGVKTGILPLKNSSRLVMNHLLDAVAPFRDLLEREIGGRVVEQVPVTFSYKDITLSGAIDTYGDKLVLLSWSKYEFKKVLEGVIQYLLLIVNGRDVELSILSFIKNQVFKARKIDRVEAEKHLGRLVDVYLTGHERLLPFILGLEFNKTEYKDWYEKIRGKFIGGDFEDDYIIKADELNMFTPDAFEEFKQLYVLIEAPLSDLFDGFKLSN